MTVEHLALLGIVVFCFMAVSSLVSAVRSFARARFVKHVRIRRPIGSPEAARSVAISIVSDIARKYSADVSISREKGELNDSLSDIVADGRRYYLSRVESIHREMFSKAVDEIILGRALKN